MEFLLWLGFQIQAFFVLLILYILVLVLIITVRYYICFYVKREKDLRARYGEWAVVTGGSYGIGKCYAMELARRNMNVILVSRTKEKLKQAAHEIALAYKVQVKYVVADLSMGKEAIGKVYKEIKHLDIGILVNNAGSSGGLPNFFHKLTRENIWELMSLNMCALTDLVHLILPAMRAKGKGLIVNMSSVSSIAPMIHASTYGASKSYVVNFSEAIRPECEAAGIDIQTLTPGFVQTTLLSCETKRSKLPEFLNPTAEKFARSAVTTIGHMKMTSGTLWFDLQKTWLELLPYRLRIIVMAYFLKMT